MPELSVSIENVTSRLTVARLRGDFEGQSLLDQKGKLTDALAAQSGRELMLDFSEVGYIDSSGIGVLVEMAKAAAEFGTRFGILNASEPVRKVLTVTRIDTVVKLYDSV